MSKKVCICGTNHGKENPLVITITTCKNRHSKPPCPSANSKSRPASKEPREPREASQPKEPRQPRKPCTAACLSLSTESDYDSSSKTRESDSGTIDNLRYSSEETCPGPTCRGRGEPVPVSNVSSCCPCSQSGGDQREKPKKEEDSEETGKKGKGKKDKGKKEKGKKEKGKKEKGKKEKKTKEKKPKEDKKKGKKEDKKKDKKKGKKKGKEKDNEEGKEKEDDTAKSAKTSYSACDLCCKPKTKDKSQNVPSEAQVKLPVLVPRYHGPGCAMEVNVLEKHDNSCRLVPTIDIVLKDRY